MFFPVSAFRHNIGRPDVGGGHSATVGKDKPEYLTFGPYKPAPPGHQLAYFYLAIDNNTAFDHKVAILEVTNHQNQRIGARVLYRRDFTQANTAQIFGVPYYNNYPHLQFRVYWYGTAYLRFHGVYALPGLQWDLDTPLFGHPAFAKQWYPVRSPQAIYPVWLDPVLGTIIDSEGRSLFERHSQMFHNIGRVCGLAFKHVPHAQAAMRFHYGTPAQVERYCIDFGNAKEWFGTNEYGSVYLAVHPDKKNVWTGSQTKDSQGGRRIGRINATRFAQHALWVAWGWPYHDPYSPTHAARNAHMSVDFRYPTTGPNTSTYGLAGFDWEEINWLRKHYGNPWLGIYEAGL